MPCPTHGRTVSHDTSRTAESLCELLHKRAALNLGVPLTLFRDNARSQQCALVWATATRLQMERCFLPAYSPNLNLRERLWKFVEKQCWYSKHYADFATFKSAIVGCLSQTHTRHKAALDSLITLRFQLFQQAQFVTA
jgi:hypothetical protein